MHDFPGWYQQPSYTVVTVDSLTKRLWLDHLPEQKRKFQTPATCVRQHSSQRRETQQSPRASGVTTGGAFREFGFLTRPCQRNFLSDVKVGWKTISHTRRCKKKNSGNDATARWSNFLGPSLTFTSECNQRSLLRLLVRGSCRDTVSIAECLSAVDKPSLSDLDTAPNTHLASTSRAPSVVAGCGSCSRQVHWVLFQFVPQQSLILHLILSLSCSLCLGSARTSSDPRTFLAVTRDGVARFRVTVREVFSSVASHKNPHRLVKSRWFAQAASWTSDNHWFLKRFVLKFVLSRGVSKCHQRIQLR